MIGVRVSHITFHPANKDFSPDLPPGRSKSEPFFAASVCLALFLPEVFFFLIFPPFGHTHSRRSPFSYDNHKETFFPNALAPFPRPPKKKLFWFFQALP